MKALSAAILECARTAAHQRKISPSLGSILEATNAELPADAARAESLAKLNKGGAAVVVTGQQTGFLLSPVFVLYKALGAAMAARTIERESGVPTVPVFWLQGEDHDLAEIESCSFPSRTGELITLNSFPEAAANRSSVSYCSPAAELRPLFDRLNEELGHFAPAREFLSIAATSYADGKSYVSAFACLLAYATKGTGLVFVNPRAPGFAAETRPILVRALEEQEEIGSLLTKKSEELRRRKIDPQVSLRAGSPLFFFHPDGPSGPRFRLEHVKEGWRLVGGAGQVRAEELRLLAETEPERFSSSALLRPLVQDSLLPTAAYLGGAAEERYSMQLEPLYPLFDFAQPCFMRRPSFTVIEPREAELLQELKLEAADLTLDDRALSAKLSAARRMPAADALQADTLSAVHSALSPLEDLFAKIDPTLLSSLEKNKAKIDSILINLANRYAEALVRGDQVESARIRRLRAMLRPRGVDQERVFSAAYFLMRYGMEFVRTVESAIQPGVGETLKLRL